MDRTFWGASFFIGPIDLVMISSVTKEIISLVSLNTKELLQHNSDFATSCMYSTVSIILRYNYYKERYPFRNDISSQKRVIRGGIYVSKFASSPNFLFTTLLQANCHSKFHCCQGFVLAQPSGPWRLTFALR